VDWFAAGVGLVLAVAVQLVGGTILFGSQRPGLLAQGLLTFAALVAGGILAGIIGPAAGAVWNALVVAVAFIVIEELANSLGPIGRFGSAGLDTLALVVDDVLVLSGATLGGVLAMAVRRMNPR
jgi:hypothetical protein